MPVRIIPKFNRAQVTKELQKRRDVIFNLIISQLQEIGEEIINAAREGGNYKDQTGNLRSSIGYVIIFNGLQKVESGFQQIKNGVEGPTIGKDVIQEIASKYPNGFVLIAVAGMEYAAAVESKNFSVLTPFATESAIKLREKMKELIKKMQSKPINL